MSYCRDFQLPATDNTKAPAVSRQGAVIIISFFFTELVLNSMDNNKFIALLPPYMQQMVYSYIESETALSKISGENIENQPLYWKILSNLPRWYELFLIALLALETDKFSKGSERLVKFILSYLIVCNLFSAIPSFVRFYFLAVPFLCFIWVGEASNLYHRRHFIFAIPLVILYGAFQLFRYVLSTNGIGILMPFPLLGVHL